MGAQYISSTDNCRNQALARFEHGERNQDMDEAAGAADATACSKISS
jgi:hypothetical protein